MKTVRVSYLGPPGTYSHQAARQQFESYASESDDFIIEYLPQPTIGACFQSLQDKKTDYSLVPFENSSNGQVVLSYDLFRDWFVNETKLKYKLDQSAPCTSESESTATTATHEQPEFRIVAEQFVPIHHNFITYSKDITKIKTIYSHPQVWSQCNKFLKNNNFDSSIHVNKIDTSSTSKAVENLKSLSQQDKQTTAAIASSTASEIHGVPISLPQIEDFKGNTTRFLVLGDSELPLPLPSKIASETSNKKLTLLTFIIKNNDDFGSLCDILEVFKKHNLNLQSITTRPSVIAAWRYVFFVEVWDNDDLEVAVDELKPLCLDLTLIGSFYRQQMYFEMIRQGMKN